MSSSGQSRITPVIIAAVVFGTATPVIKLLLLESHPLAIAAFLYLGAGAGILILGLLTSASATIRSISSSMKGHAGLLAGTVLAGGIIAPVVQFSALSVAPAATASLLLNFEIIATAGFAWGIFHERITRNLVFAIVLVLLGSLVLTSDAGTVWGFSIGAAGIVLSCIFWGLDNNLMAKIASENSSAVIVIKGLAGGGILFLTAWFIHVPLPVAEVILLALLTGFCTFGLGLIFLIESLRNLGAAKTAGYFATAPFIGALGSLFLFRQTPGLQILISLPLFVAGVLILVSGRKNEHGNRMHDRLPGLKIRILLSRISRNAILKIKVNRSLYINHENNID